MMAMDGHDAPDTFTAYGRGASRGLASSTPNAERPTTAPPFAQMLGAEMIQAGDHRPSPRAYGRERREARRDGPPPGAPEPSPMRRISRRGWAILAAVAIAAILWGILIVSVAYFASHYSVAHAP